MTGDLLLSMANDETTVAGLQMPTWILWLIAISVIVGAAHTIYTKAVVPLRRIAKKITTTYEKVMEYDDRLRTVEVHTVQLKNNGGSSLRDAVDRIEVRQKKDRDTFNEHLQWSQEQALEVWKQIAARDVMHSAERTADKIDEGVKRNS